MIYLDNAATTFPKPKKVREAMIGALGQYGGNPGRGGHTLAFAASEAVYRCRQTAAEFFGANQPDQVVFTLNCTMALNMVIKGILRSGGRVVISDVEHNAVLRPAFAISSRRPIYDIATVDFTDSAKTVQNFRRAITPETRLIVCTHASNVWGRILPIREIGALASELHIPFCVDAAQTAGVIPIDMEKDHIDFLCVAGHKGLYGPMGTGMLISSGKYSLPSFVEGGTGSRSMDPVQPDFWPDHMESGTPNTAGICGLCAGMEWVKALGIENISSYETRQAMQLYRFLRDIPAVKLYTPPPTEEKYVPVISFNLQSVPSEQVAKWLNDAGVAVRAGLHCAPMAHRKIGTENTGTVRIAPSVFTTPQDVEKVHKILLQTARKALQYQ